MGSIMKNCVRARESEFLKANPFETIQQNGLAYASFTQQSPGGRPAARSPAIQMYAVNGCHGTFNCVNSNQRTVNPASMTFTIRMNFRFATA
ncbi:hypothetical protein [Burkholderia sp. lig30]|jgi:hypothetical protein|uniref:hypothetical protein n=1 Tax=Burkholderia sp. lig30 TaxID=1192124 RepID=UPI00128F5B6A|nr:hypothetical protein [Burkholderia sp. lig30]